MGATLYVPASRPDLVNDLVQARRRGTTSVVLDLEDAVADRDRSSARERVMQTLRLMDDDAAPGLGLADVAVFVRLRATDDIDEFLQTCGRTIRRLTGIALPKATPASIDATAAALAGAEHRHRGALLSLMPIVETREFVQAHVRHQAISGLRQALDRHSERILCVRFGSTDLAGLHGVRRTPDVNAHEVHFLSATIGDLVSMLGGEGGYCVSGGVWEHLVRHTRVLRPQLRQTPFVEGEHLTRISSRQSLIGANLDGLIREVLLDRANGLTGKSVIHPDQALVVSAMGIVDHAEYLDAVEILSDRSGGAQASVNGQRMIECRPHGFWARSTLDRAAACGVLRPDRTFADALDIHFAEADAMAGMPG
ncbi:MAG: HpcH/HpaI aldolase/citrate lyase family protein [Kineosporiaceae bacterium]|nr:HpcH/HpaI aldolase/citrate lyase family protein [Kineosporiaceae bacterium]MBK7624416.1 HpcH/HpaI aldolase/citrate lyase family protein [Kineosporiaceae bacterium]MBK8077780.1 HpcH/HpaI aldolase/citrate lyase family protein [Kineosporiaceae bacterium]